MTQRTYTRIDKSNWGPGPWQGEPDKVQWIDEETGLDCLAVRNGFGVWCGYVGVPPGHLLHGVSDGDLPPDLDVHGGLNYAAPCQEGRPEDRGICHVPAPGRAKDVWWFGFDCGRAGDLMPRVETARRELGRPTPGEIKRKLAYRALGYVRRECASLARQLAQARGRS